MENQTLIRNLEQASIIRLDQQVIVETQQTSSMTLVQRPNFGMTLFALDQGQEIKKHSSPGDAMVNVIEGVAEITIGDDVYNVRAGETIIMPSTIPHGLRAAQDSFKMLLIIVKP